MTRLFEQKWLDTKQELLKALRQEEEFKRKGHVEQIAAQTFRIGREARSEVLDWLQHDCVWKYSARRKYTIGASHDPSTRQLFLTEITFKEAGGAVEFKLRWL